MSSPTVTHSTYAIERQFANPPAVVFAAFEDPVKKQRWFAGGEGSALKEYALDFRVGGFERTRSLAVAESPVKGSILANDTVYQDIVPGKRIVFAYTMAVGERRISASLVTVELLPIESGTNLIFTEQAAFFEHADGPQLREAGWRQILASLGRELEQ